MSTANSQVKSIFEHSIKIEPYAPWTWPDIRIGWDRTYVVTVNGVQGPVGFTDGPLEEIRK